MNLEKFTDKTRSLVQAAQSLANRAGHQRLVGVHILAAMMADEQALAANLISASGGDKAAVSDGTEAALAALPKVSGGDGQLYLDPEVARVMEPHVRAILNGLQGELVRKVG